MSSIEKKAREKADKLKKNKSSSSSSNIKDDSPKVFGSFGLQYPVTGIEIDRADGVTLINSNPEVRVFVCGGELTKDVISVEIGHKINDRGTCSIQLANPRGKYNISINDLVSSKEDGLWREDKSIQATYDYDWLKKQVPSKFAEDNKNVNSESKLKKLGNTVLGKQITDTISSVATGINNMTRSRGKGFTQMLYEVKQASNMSKSVGETIFDYRDPVYVFMKGRFSSYWYFAFSGFVEGIDDAFAYGGAQTITLSCHDVAGYLKRVRFLQQGTFLSNANMEGSLQNTNLSRITNIYDKPVGSFSQVVKTIMYAADGKFVDNVVNTHFSNSDECKAQTDAALSKEPYKVKNEYYSIFREQHKFDSTHTDDMKRNNIGKQFREFKLINSTNPASTEKVEILTINDVGFITNRAQFKNVSSAKNTLTSILQDIDKIYKKDKSLTWTVVGHCALISTNQPFLTDKETGQSTPFDLGQRFTTYANNYYNAEHDCIDIPSGTQGFPDGHGYTLSLNRAKKTKELMVSIANEQFKDIATLVQNLNVTSVGNAEPRNTSRTKFKKADLGRAELLALADKNSEDPKNSVNMYVEVIPSSMQISVVDESDDKVDFNAYFKDPHLLKFSPLSGLYYQFNEIDIDDFTAANLEVYYNTAVRYWLKGPGTNLDSRQLYDPDRTGWMHTHGFGVCGIHPALTYNFIDNFEILPDIHKVTKERKLDLDGATLTPIDIIKEHVIGVSTELTPLGDGTKGFQKNYFRPRIFVVRPIRFRNRERNTYSLSEFTLDKENSQSTWEVLSRLILDAEYTVYSSPMGDIFVEPLFHDSHPLDFHGKVEDRSVAPRKFNAGTKEWEYAGVEVYFRTEINTREEPIIGYRKDYAYAFNSKANHPFFISNKDIIRVTDTIKPENLVSHVIVEGSVSGQDSGLIEHFASLATQGAIPFIDFQSTAKRAAEKIRSGENFDTLDRESNQFNVNLGIYLANGFFVSRKADQLKVDTVTSKYKSQHDDLHHTYNYKLKGELLQKRANNTIKALVELATTSIMKTASDNTVVYNNAIKKIIEKYAQNKEYVDKGISDMNLRNTNLSHQAMTVLKNLAPSIYGVFSNLVEYEEKKSNNQQVVLAKDDILKAYDISTVSGERGLLSLTPAKLLNIDYSANPALNERIDAFIKLSDPNLALDGSASKAFLNDFLVLVEAICIADSSAAYVQFKEANSTLYSLRSKFTILAGVSGYLTKGDLKKYEELQIYNPAKDYLSKYGWNPGPRVKNVYINNGTEAEIYAKILFDKINSNAFHLNCDMIGRPELMLNRPYYNEYKNTIGLCSEYSLSYSFGAVFRSNVKLNYLRRNSITYSYTQGSLDKITTIFDAKSEDAKLNTFFNTKALNHLKSLNNKGKTDARLALLGTPIAATAKAVIKEVNRLKASKSSNKANVSKEIVPDGIYVAHDWIGHLSAGDKMIPSEIRKAKLTSTDVSDPKYISQLDGFIISKNTAEVITIKNTLLHKSFLLLQEGEAKLANVSKLLLADNAEKTAQQARMDALVQEMEEADPENVRIRSRFQREWDSVIVQHNNTNYKIESNNSVFKNLNSSVEKLIFQIYGVKGHYDAVAGVRIVKLDKDNTKGLLGDLYQALPEKDLQKQVLRAYYDMVDDVYYKEGGKATVKNFDSSVPIYFIFKSINATSADRSKEA